MPRSAKPQEHRADAGADRNANPGPARPRALRHHSRFQTIPGTDMRQPPTFAALLLALTLLALPAAAQDPPLTTVAARPGFVQTGRHAEVVELCGALAERYPPPGRRTDFRPTPQGPPLQPRGDPPPASLAPHQSTTHDLHASTARSRRPHP